MNEPESDDWADYESGPFCRHWDDWECPLRCATCGCRCFVHDVIDNDCLECECKEWKEPE